MTTLDELIQRSTQLRERYHALEKSHHGSVWTTEEDALAFLTDAGLVGRLTMAHEGRWPHASGDDALAHKLAECMWWLIVLADRMDIDLPDALERFLPKTA